MQPPSEDLRDFERHFLLRQADTEARLDRVENSLFFRLMRRAGAVLGYRPNHTAGEDFATWVEQRSWIEPSTEECKRRMAGWGHAPSVTCVSGGDASAFHEEMCLSQADYVAIVPPLVQLSPTAKFRWVEFLRDRPCDAAYSDWDHIDAAGRLHTPCFTPEFSPRLLQDAPYWGECFLIRTGLLRQLATDIDPAGPGWLHTLAMRAAESAKIVGRIPHITWHATSEPVSAGGSPLRAGDPAQASIVICTRTPRLLERCLRALRATDAARAEIVVVAHDCRIDSTQGVAVVPYSGQFHYGVMNELGVAKSTRPVIVLLNDDVEPISPAWLGALLGALEGGAAGIAGGLLLYPNGTIQHAGVSVGGRRVPAHMGRWQTSSPVWPWLRTSREVSAVTGACMAIRRTVWDQLGGFDRRFPVNYNDVDLCLRARRAGFQVVLETSAVLCHREAQTRNSVVAPPERVLFESLWARDLVNADPFFNPNLALPDERIALAPPLYTSFT